MILKKDESKKCVYCSQSITFYEKPMAIDNWGGYAHKICWEKYEVQPRFRLEESQNS